MGLRIGTNVSSISARRNLSQVTGALNRNFSKLSTGKRIATAADDAAGQAISARLKAQIRGTDQAVRNANDGISLIQTAEGALQEVEDTLIRARELAVQANNGTLTGTDRDSLQTEFSEILATISQVADGTEFNGQALLNSTASITLQVGANTTTGVDTLDVSTTSVTTSDLGVASLDIGSGGDASAAITAIDGAIDTISTARGQFGASQNRLERAIATLQVRSENLSAANSRIEDVDVASETASLTKNSILQQAALSVLAQANVQPQSALSLLG